MTPINWSYAEVSAHDAMRLVPIAEEMIRLSPEGFILPIHAGKVATVLPDRRAGGWVAHHAHELSLATRSIPRREEKATEIHYDYRDADGYTAHASAILSGVPDRLGLALILTAMTLGDDAMFIPSQLGLKDIQDETGSNVDFSGADHVWHSLASIESSGRAAERGAISDLIDRARGVVSTGAYDIAAAMRAGGAHWV